MPCLKRILIEKPLEASYRRGKEIKLIAGARNLSVSVGYNLRFINAFDAIKKFINRHEKDIRIVEVAAGQDLREWRPYKDAGSSYSACRKLGGGVDLDLSHEIDYILWLFGRGFKKRIVFRARVSDLEIDSPDVFKLVLEYKKFIIDMLLDYIRRPKERYLKIICEGGGALYYDFVMGRLTINQKTYAGQNETEESYKKMLRAFLGIDRRNRARLCSVEEGMDVLRVLGI